MSIADLKPLAEQNLPQVTFQGNTPEERMLSGFVLAKQYMAQLIPAGHTVDSSAAIAAQESYEKQIVERKDIVASSLSTRQDLPEAAALTQESAKSKEYWISTYALAAEGIAAYATGYAKQQVAYSNLSETEYYAGIEVRTKSFASIVHAGQNGYLAQLVTPDEWYASKMESSQDAQVMRAAGQLTGGGRIVLGSQGSKLYALNTTNKLLPVGLGVDPSGGIVTILVIGAVVALIAVGTVGFICWRSVEKERIRTSAEFMGQMCKKADQDPQIAKACAEYAQNISQPTPQPFGLENLSKYLVWGAVGLGVLYMLPNLMERFEQASFRSSIRKAASGR